MDVVATFQSELEALRSRIKILESENANLSARLSNCHCQETKENGNGSLVKNGKKKNKLGNLGCGAMAMHRFLKRYVALKVMYFGARFYGFASEAQMDPTVEGELFRALERTRLIFGDKKELQYSRCGRTDRGVSSVGQVIFLFLRSNYRESRVDDKYSGEIPVEESSGLLISPYHVLQCLAFLISHLTCTYCYEIWHMSVPLPFPNITYLFSLYASSATAVLWLSVAIFGELLCWSFWIAH